MTDSVMSSKEREKETGQNEDEKPSDYYYDDSTGYRTYHPDEEDDETEAEPEED